VLRPLALIRTVSNLDKSVAFYREVGLRVAAMPAFPSDNSAAARKIVGAPRAGVKSVTLSIPGSEFRLVLVQVSGARQKRIEQRIQDPGAVNLTLRVHDDNREFAAIRDDITGVYTVGGKVMLPEGPGTLNQSVIVKDPDGFAVELAHPGKLSTTIPAGSDNIAGGWPTLSTGDPNRSLQFYEKLGFKKLRERQLPASVLALEGTPNASAVTDATTAPGSPYTFFFFSFGNIDQTQLNAELKDVGGSAVSYLVTGLPSLLSSLRQSGTVVETPLKVAPNVEAAFVRDPNGLLVEFVQVDRQ
jgi:catechol 2,3-dioxygenase-like lactoylglutathione lyase family enzyme